MKAKTAPTYCVEVHIAGGYDAAVEACRAFCIKTPLCVSLTRQDFVYTQGAESGVRVLVLNYPRFPSNPRALRKTAARLGLHLMLALHQGSFRVVDPKKSTWTTRRGDR